MWARWIEAGAGASAGTAFELLLSSGCVTPPTSAGMHCRCSVRAIVGGELAWTGRQNVTEVEEWLGYT